MSTDRPSRTPHEEFLAQLAALDEVLRAPIEPLRPPLAPPDLGFDEPRDLVVLPPNALTPRTPATFPAPPRWRVSGPWVGALGAGLVAGGLLGWWFAASPIVPIPPADSAARAPTTAAPAASRAMLPAPLPAAARVAAPVAPVAPVNRGATSRLSSSPSPGPLATPRASAPSAIAGGSGIRSGTIVPAAPVPLMMAPLMAAPLMAVPLRSSPPMLPEAPALAAAKAIAAVAADEAAIENTLREYEQAYERLDAKAARAVWPTVDQRALSRAFAGLASQALVFRGCEVVVRAGASTATASCRGTAEYVQKVGDARVRVEPRQWTFTLNKTQGEWRIDAVDGQR